MLRNNRISKNSQTPGAEEKKIQTVRRRRTIKKKRIRGLFFLTSVGLLFVSVKLQVMAFRSVSAYI